MLQKNAVIAHCDC